MGHSRPTTLAQVTTNTVGARTESSCPVSTRIIRRAYRVHAHTCVRWRATFVACPEIVRRLRLRERRPTCAHMGSEESTLQPGIVGTCANVEYRVSDAMRGPFCISIVPSIQHSQLCCGLRLLGSYDDLHAARWAPTSRSGADRHSRRVFQHSRARSGRHARPVLVGHAA